MTTKIKRTTKHQTYISIFGNYQEDDLTKKVMVIPKVITQDIGFELHFGFKALTSVRENQYLNKKV